MLAAGKLEVLQQICKEEGIYTQPKQLDGLWVAPIISWYHASWDREPDIPGAPAIEKVSEEGGCLRCMPTCHQPSLLFILGVGLSLSRGGRTYAAHFTIKAISQSVNHNKMLPVFLPSQVQNELWLARGTGI